MAERLLIVATSFLGALHVFKPLQDLLYGVLYLSMSHCAELLPKATGIRHASSVLHGGVVGLPEALAGI